MDYSISDRPISEQRSVERPIVEQRSAPRQTMIIHTHYDTDTDTSGWSVVRTLPGAILECRTGTLPHTTAERAFLSTLLIELFALPQDASVIVATLTSYPILLLHACRPWVWRVQDWHEEGQPIANADLWDKLLPCIDERCVTWHILTRNQYAQLDALLARRLARVAAHQGVTTRAVGAPYTLETHCVEGV